MIYLLYKCILILVFYIVITYFQVHKEKVDKTPNALSHRSNTDIEIYGMEGIPDEDLRQHEREKLGKDRKFCSSLFASDIL